MPYWGINEGTLYLSDTETTYANESFDWPSGSISASTWPWHSERSNILNVEATALNTSNATNMAYMFNGCKALTDIDINDWDVSNIVDMRYMFYNCPTLTLINMGDWDTSSVTNMSYMFEYCSALTSLNLRNWTVDKVADFSVMFAYCPTLTTIYCNNDWSTNTSATGTEEVFFGCSSLTGAISYDATKKGLAYANPTTGYFTIKTVSNSSVSLYLGIDNLARPSSSIYVGVNGVARKVIAGYVGVNGVAKSIYSSNIDKLPTIGTPLSDWTWSEIITLANSGKDVTKYFSVGDEKELTLTTGEIITVVIGDFYHNTITGTETKAPIAFTFKNCLNTLYAMNDSWTNAGGWDGSNMRKTHMVNIFNKFPAELRADGAVKYVDVVATAGSESTSLVTSSDRLRLHSITELGLTYSYAGTEGTKYAYYTSGNRVKTVGGGTSTYWTRSPHINYSFNFCCVNSSGVADYYGTTIAYGVACGFDI